MPDRHQVGVASTAPRTAAARRLPDAVSCRRPRGRFVWAPLQERSCRSSMCSALRHAGAGSCCWSGGSRRRCRSAARTAPRCRSRPSRRSGGTSAPRARSCRPRRAASTSSTVSTAATSRSACAGVAGKGRRPQGLRARFREDAEANLRSGLEPIAERSGATSSTGRRLPGAGFFFAGGLGGDRGFFFVLVLRALRRAGGALVRRGVLLDPLVHRRPGVPRAARPVSMPRWPPGTISKRTSWAFGQQLDQCLDRR